VLSFNQEYWDNYYGGPYEETFALAFPLRLILTSLWPRFFDEAPESFADIGCGTGHTLQLAEQILPDDAFVYGVECQKIPEERVVHSSVLFGDFLDVSHQLPAVDLLYVSCSMYIPWDKQREFLTECVRLTKKAVVFANLYLEDGVSIPYDCLRKTIYKDRKGFHTIMDNYFGFTSHGTQAVDFFVKPKIQ